MEVFPGMTAEQRRTLCEEAGLRLGLSPASLEKDFWVCWTLRDLFALPGWSGHLTFKGGTSLSKAWGVISRFSEDIDIVVSREFLGFGGPRDPEAAPSRKQRRIRLEALKAECRRRIETELGPALEHRFRAALPLSLAWRLVLSDEDPDGQTLLFEYPTVFSGAAYVRPVVKIEMGARSDTEPAETPSVHPYLADAFPALFGACGVQVRALAPERTFWEKAMLVHEENSRPEGRGRKARLSRHYYDLWCLIDKGVAARAAAIPGMFERVVAHRQTFFNFSWMDYSSVTPGTLRLVPPPEQIEDWQRDYEAMRREMFFGEVPEFEKILEAVDGFRKTFFAQA